MTLSVIWVGMIGLSLVFGIATGNTSQVAQAALSGASTAVELCLSLAGILCLWSGVMEVLSRSGLADSLTRLFQPLFRRWFPNASRDEEARTALSANFTANLLGLGNAATPLGMKAARRMARGTGGTATDELCLLVVLNTASVQLIPATVAGVRTACGSAAAFDILPCVWLTSLCSVTAGLTMAHFLARRGRRL